LAIISRPLPAPVPSLAQCSRRKWAICLVIWILAGVVFAGAVQDFIILFVWTRRDGRSLGDMIKSEMGAIPGLIALFGVLAIMVILLAVLARIVVKALPDSPRGTFTVCATMPIAMLMGIYGRFLRPHRIGEMSAIMGAVDQKAISKARAAR
jgi:carbon starvation protein